jgi:hypothetical protein
MTEGGEYSGYPRQKSQGEEQKMQEVNGELYGFAFEIRSTNRPLGSLSQKQEIVTIVEQFAAEFALHDTMGVV